MELATGLPAQDAVGRPLLDVLPILRHPDEEARLRRVLAGEECPADARHAGPIWRGAAYVPLRDRDGRTIGGVALRPLASDANPGAERQDGWERLAFLAEAGRILAHSLDFEETLQNVARLLVPARADWCVVYRLREDNTVQRLVIVHRDARKEEIQREVERRFPIQLQSENPIAVTLRTGKAVLLPRITDPLHGAEERDGELVELLLQIGFRSGITVPLRARDRMLGCLAIARTESDTCYTPADLALLEEIAERCAVALDNAHLHRELQRSEESLRFLAEASAILSSSLDVDTVLQTVARLVVPHMADVCIVYVAEADGRIRRRAHCHSNPLMEQRLRDLDRDFPVDASAPVGIANVFRTGRSEFHPVADAATHRPAAADEQQVRLTLDLGYRSIILVPMHVRGRVVGAISLARADLERRFDLRDLAAAEDLAQRCALAVENASLYQRLQQELNEREATHAALQRSESRARRIVESGIIGIAYWGSEGRITTANDTFLRMSGYNRADVAAGTLGWRSLIPVKWRPHALTAGAQIRKRGACEPFEMECLRKDGTCLPVIMAAARFEDTMVGAPLEGVTYILDISERQRLEQATRQQAHDLREANRSKDEFLAMLAHELRNPLGPVTNALHLLNLTRDEEKRRGYQAVAERQVRRLARLVDDLLDVARITSGNIPLQLEELDLVDAVRQSALSAQSALMEGGHHLRIDLPASTILVRADSIRLEQILTNLLTNAAKYTPPGGCVELSASATTDVASVRVRDNGVGIDPELLPRVFDLFTQGKRSLDRSQGGLGVGLTLVRRLAEMHGGTISASSAGVGLGSEFVLCLPVAASGDSKSPTPVGAHGHPDAAALSPRVMRSGSHAHTGAGSAASQSPVHTCGSVLVVEDNADAAEILAEMLRLWSYDAEVASSGPEALRRAPVMRPEVVLLDIGLPGLDGYAVVRRLASMPETEGAKFVALTGYGTAEDRARALEAGFHEHLTKPVDPDALRRVLESLCAAVPK